MKNKQLMMMSLFISLGVVLSFVERLIPTPFLVAGAKLGLANIITVTTLKLFDKKTALIILLVRVILVSALFAGFSGFLYSFTGGILSFTAMLLMIKLNIKEVSLVGVSVIGATMHNIGQVLVASILFNNFVIMSYLPVLMFTGVITGIFIGLVANKLTDRLITARII